MASTRQNYFRYRYFEIAKPYVSVKRTNLDFDQKNIKIIGKMGSVERFAFDIKGSLVNFLGFNRINKKLFSRWSISHIYK